MLCYRRQNSAVRFLLNWFQKNPSFPHEVIGGRKMERDGRKTQAVNRKHSPSKQEMSVLQKWRLFLQPDSSLATYKAPQIPCLHKIKFQLRSILTNTSTPSEMNKMYFRAKVFTKWQKNMYWIMKQEEKINKFTKYLIT